MGSCGDRECHHLTLDTAVSVNICLPMECQLHEDQAFSVPLRAVSSMPRLAPSAWWMLCFVNECIRWTLLEGTEGTELQVSSVGNLPWCGGRVPRGMAGAPTVSATITTSVVHEAAGGSEPANSTLP